MMFRCKSARAFVLLEVIIALTILTITVSAILRSFTQSLDAIRQLEVRTQAGFLAQELLDKYEAGVLPNEEGIQEGDFGETSPDFTYAAEIRYEYPDYKDVKADDIEQLFPTKALQIDIYYDNHRNRSFRAVSISTAIMGFEHKSEQLKKESNDF